MKKKVLFCATVDYHFKAFHLPYFQWFQEQGWEVHTAANGQLELPYVDQAHLLPIQRSPFHVHNRFAYVELKKLLAKEHYDFIHCHTPMGSVIGRLAAKSARKKGTKVLYTAHGFHFWQGAPLQNWLLYYPIERWLARHTDALITINGEDFKRADRLSKERASVYYVPGMGVDMKRFAPVNEKEKQRLRAVYGFSSEDFIVLCAGELNANKNQGMLIKACAQLYRKIPNVKIVFAGEGAMRPMYEKLAHELHLEKHIHFVGFCKQIEEWMHLSDVCVSTSLREGLGMNLLEAISAEKPVIATENRGHCELIRHGVNGFLVKPHDVNDLAEYLHQLYHKRDQLPLMGKAGRSLAHAFAKEQTLSAMQEIYTTYMDQAEKVM
ncbi:glycosyltransferase family 4 protein [Bacillus altitudinis]|uniref:glycosyltransferase family 4 protein n=1 Tax=Bacillus pumilus TaxID=1408 RepID=UPI0025A00370|nr:glycosyltransferase family 4 protein [Bacillus pumilus]MDM5321523.1 glycosyltransferase family 4 protein [Bacillus pumilus]MDR4995029.1 glycosyltransferase family 4 protein [Bacillus altitudinis]